MEIKSPITGKNNVELIKEIDTRFLIRGYREALKVDVEKFFKGLEKISLYRCGDTGYKFFYPPVEGDGEFYAQLQKNPWYYMDWKWEHEKAMESIGDEDKVLEVGTAKGDFLKRLKDRGNSVVGLETNPEAAKQAKAKGIPVYEEYLDAFVKRTMNDFDDVCFFQVLEHINETGAAIKDALAVLKTGGKLIVSVPNEGSFLNEDKKAYLNMPPHHAGLWDKDSLSALARIFGMKLESIAFEPLQKYHYGYFYHVKIGYNIRKRFGLPGKIFNKIAVLLLTPFFMMFGDKIKGHTIIAVYQKIK